MLNNVAFSSLDSENLGYEWNYLSKNIHDSFLEAFLGIKPGGPINKQKKDTRLKITPKFLWLRKSWGLHPVLRW